MKHHERKNSAQVPLHAGSMSRLYETTQLPKQQDLLNNMSPKKSKTPNRKKVSKNMEHDERTQAIASKLK